ncbi:MAG: secretion system protein, partial [Haloarculaceae archaeon]
GHGVVGTTHADDIETLVNRVIEKGVPTYLLREIDLVVFPRHVDGDRYVGEVVTFTEEPVRRDDGRSGTVRKDGTALHYETVCWRRSDGGYDFPGESRWGDDSATVLNRLADLRDQPVDEVRQALDRRHRYVQYLVREGVTDFDALFGILADLTTNEAATVERLRREQGEAGPASVEVSDDAG